MCWLNIRDVNNNFALFIYFVKKIQAFYITILKLPGTDIYISYLVFLRYDTRCCTVARREKRTEIFNMIHPITGKPIILGGYHAPLPGNHCYKHAGSWSRENTTIFLGCKEFHYISLSDA